MSGMLYYPTVTPPRPVVHRAVLYWDRLATVVPAYYERHLDSSLLQVLDAGLYQPVSVERIASDPLCQQDALGAFAWLVMNYPPDDLIPPDLNSAYELLRQPREEFEQYVLTPSLKLRRRMVEEMIRRRLAVLDPSLPDLLWVSPRVQTCLIGIMAREVARRLSDQEGCTSEQALFPHTEIPQAHLAAVGGGNPGEDEQPCWKVDIGPLLPVPSQGTRIADVIAFRQRYDDERRRLMLAVDRLTHGLALEYDHPKDVFRSIQGELSPLWSTLSQPLGPHG
jgi:hypothetical protein